MFEGTWAWGSTPLGRLGVMQSGAQRPQNGRNPLLSRGLRVRATLRCPKAKRSQAVKGGPSVPSDGSRAAAPLTACGAELRPCGLAYAFSEGPDPRIVSNGGAPRAC